MGAFTRGYKIISTTGFLFVFLSFLPCAPHANNLFNVPEVGLPSDVEAYFSLAIELEIKGYRVRDEIQRKVIQPMKRMQRSLLMMKIISRQKVFIIACLRFRNECMVKIIVKQNIFGQDWRGCIQNQKNLQNVL